MKKERNVQPWFPLMPYYIDKFLDGVLKYLRDESETPSDDAPSLNTTKELLRQRAEGTLVSPF